MKQETIIHEPEWIEVLGAREHNLKNINISIPRNALVVLTGVSGSGKSSLAFDTIYAEGQRRYMESFSAYARSFMGGMERPDVDKINGLSPVISIEQKTTSRNPRSTVGTVTEIYDFLRLLYARASDAYSYVTGKPMIRQSEEQIQEVLLKEFLNKKIIILAPVVKGRKGHYRELFQQLMKSGFSKVRVDGEIIDIHPKLQVDRYKIHDIEIVIDRILVDDKDISRLTQSIRTAMVQGKGVLQIVPLNEKGKEETPRFFSKYLMDPESGISYDEPAPNLFSFNSPYGACPCCNGLGKIEEITIDSIIPDKTTTISRGGILPLGEYRDIWIFKELSTILKKFKLALTTPIKDIPEPVMELLLNGVDAYNEFEEGIKKLDFEFEGVLNFLKKQQEDGSDKIQKWLSDFVTITTCNECNGSRLKKESLYFLIDNKNIFDLSSSSIKELSIWFKDIESRLTSRQLKIGAEVIKEIKKRIGFLVDVGLEYLSCDRPMRSLSGGEAQRIRLATQIGTQLVGVLYILDEPSIGLHQRDNVKLIEALKNLRDLGNTVMVVEHDKDMMLASDWIVDIGPGAGRHGGSIVAQGAPKVFLEQHSKTAQFLNGELAIEVPKDRRKGNGKTLELIGASGNNLKNVDLKIPLGTLTCITGVSGSGKSTLIHETLYPILNKHFFNARKEPMPFKKISGLEFIDKVIEVDQTPIGRTPRSNPATYTEVFSEIRNLYTQLPEAKIRGYKAGRFSFNVKGGRCEVCEGAGMKLIEMEFLPDVYVPCESCKGARYNRETLEVRFKGKSIADVLNMTVEQAVEFFEAQPRILAKIQALQEVGLGYITLGQHSPTLSGGEAQRIKLATELSKRETGQTLYILDEPTTGLHFQDIKALMDIVNRLVEKGNSVLIIEHNLDVIKLADYIVDMGIEGGNSGGTIVIEGTPEQVVKSKTSHTAKYLKEELK